MCASLLGTLAGNGGEIERIDAFLLQCYASALRKYIYYLDELTPQDTY
jgi:hypothetical protein